MKEAENIILRKIKLTDCLRISTAFEAQGWQKPVSLYEQYCNWQTTGKRDIIVADFQDNFAGYLTIKWQSDYPPFRAQNIPEINDFNVLKKYQRLGIGTLLMDEAERRIEQKSNYAGIGFGITKDYGAAQILYIKRGYLPDGNGLMRHMQPLDYGDQVIINDDLAFYLTKQLK